MATFHEDFSQGFSAGGAGRMVRFAKNKGCEGDGSY